MPLERHPTWDLNDQIIQLAESNIAWGSDNYYREYSKIIDNWGRGYMEFLKSDKYVTYDSFKAIELRMKAGVTECGSLLENIPPSKRPSKYFCRGYATTGLVTGVNLSDIQQAFN